MDLEWNDSAPIYRQLRDRVVDMILDGVLKNGDSLPSVRNVAAEYRVNPLTVLKGYQQLVDEDLVEKRRASACSSKTALAICFSKASAKSFWPNSAAHPRHHSAPRPPCRRPSQGRQPHTENS